MIAAICGTIVSSPLNYVRNIHYATHPKDTLRPSTDILRELVVEGRANGAMYVVRQLRVGWGTLRVGCGMAVGGYVYGAMRALMEGES